MALLPVPLGMANFLVHHIHAFTIYVIILIFFSLYSTNCCQMGSLRLYADGA
jgi:hypothetical protein